MTKPIETTFENLTFDLIKQLIERADDVSKLPVATLWFDRSFISDLVQMSEEVNPVLERDLLAAGYIGSLSTLKSKHGALIELRTLPGMSPEAEDGVEPEVGHLQIACKDSKGTNLLIATKMKAGKTVEPLKDKSFVTWFDTLNFDLVKQLVKRAEERSDEAVVNIWLTRDLLSPVIKNMADRVDPITNREKLFAGHVGDLDMLNRDKNFIPLRATPKGVSFWGTNEAGDILFTAIQG